MIFLPTQEMISVIIPTLNEEEFIGRCLDALRAEGDFEVVVADGGSYDRTCEIAEGRGAKVVRTENGRGLQMNRGAASADGDIFLFLHADTVLEKGWSADICSILKDGAVTGGCFTFAIDRPEPQYRLIEKWVKLRCGLFGLPYGDQGLFMSRRQFEGLGGYREIPLMEDVDIVKRMKDGGKIVMLQSKAFTHHRKWEKDGWMRRSLKNQVIMLLYRLGADPKKLFRLYYR